jgi:hypothetical protein
MGVGTTFRTTQEKTEHANFLRPGKLGRSVLRPYMILPST